MTISRLAASGMRIRVCVSKNREKLKIPRITAIVRYPEQDVSRYCLRLNARTTENLIQD